MVGGTKDPPNGPAVAATIFTAVIVYAVCLSPSLLLEYQEDAKIRRKRADPLSLGLRCLLWPSGVPTLQREPEGGDSTVVAMEVCGSSEQSAQLGMMAYRIGVWSFRTLWGCTYGF